MRCGGRLAVLLIACAVLAGCGVTPPYQTSTAPAPTTPTPTATAAPTTPEASPLVVEPTPAASESDPPATPDPNAQPAPSAPSTAPTSPAPAVTPSPTPQTDGEVDCRKASCVALTFDDGPGPYTMTLLRHLQQANVPATFFMLGEKVKAQPAIALAVADAGHELGVHTWDHRRLTRLTAEQVREELTSTIKLIKKTTGQRPALLRPPYGETDHIVAAEAKKAKLAQILWDVDTLDWKTRSTKKTVKAALKQTKRGSILLLHDIHATSVAAVPAILEGLQKKGYTFVTVSHLLGKTKPGRVYSRA